MYVLYTLTIIAAILSSVVASTFEGLSPREAGPDRSQCYTRVAATRAGHGVSTNWHTSYTSCTVTSTKTVKTTVTPKSTVTRTITSTSTVATASTVAAPATFTPIRSSLPGSSYSGSGGADPVGKRDATNNYSAFKRASSGKAGLVARPGHPKYPQGVDCYRWTHNKCSTKVVTSTSVVVKSSTKLVTRTTTTTVTSTTTISTIYAACATNNFADADNGQPFIEVEGGFTAVFDTTVGSAYACCVAAITFNAPNAQPDTSIFAFQPGSTGPANCFIGQTSDTCPNPASNPSTAITGAGGSLVLGNSYCGEINAAVAVLVPSSSAVAKRTEATGAV